MKIDLVNYFESIVIEVSVLFLIAFASLLWKLRKLISIEFYERTVLKEWNRMSKVNAILSDLQNDINYFK